MTSTKTQSHGFLKLIWLQKIASIFSVNSAWQVCVCLSSSPDSLFPVSRGTVLFAILSPMAAILPGTSEMTKQGDRPGSAPHVWRHQDLALSVPVYDWFIKGQTWVNHADRKVICKTRILICQLKGVIKLCSGLDACLPRGNYMVERGSKL